MPVLSPVGRESSRKLVTFWTLLSQALPMRGGPACGETLPERIMTAAETRLELRSEEHPLALQRVATGASRAGAVPVQATPAQRRRESTGLTTPPPRARNGHRAGRRCRTSHRRGGLWASVTQQTPNSDNANE